MKYNRACQGFTLIEVAVVLVIIALLVGSFIGTVSSRIETTRYMETTKELTDIKQALIGYVYKNGDMPCPDTTGNGVSAVDCVIINNGFVPWVTLGLGASDAWNNRYAYWLDTNFSTAFDLDTITVSGGQVMTRNVTGTALIPLSSNVVAVVYTGGKNGFGTTGEDGLQKAPIPSTGHDDEDENGNGDQVFVSRPPSYLGDTTNVGTFDDVVIWISEYELKAKMVEAGVLP